MKEKIKLIANEFEFTGDLVNIEENNQGNINKTYVLTYVDKGKKIKYLIQKINTSVFKEPYIVMKNIDSITKYINNKLKMLHDNKHKSLDIIKTKNNDNLYSYTNNDGEKEYYRAYQFIEHCISYDNFQKQDNPCEIAYNVGRGFGFFQRMLNDYPINELNETIVDFHNTPKRFDALLESIKNNVNSRALELSNEIISIITKIKQCSIIMDKLGKTIPYRVCHNDTKVNNVLMDKDTNEMVAVIDLDTVMPGSCLFDIGDGIRSAASNTYEDDTNLKNIYLNLDYAKAYLKGYLEEMRDYLTKDEVKYMALSIKILTLELAMRFLTDYINGDTYFKIQYKTHNKDRFLNQYHLLLDIENKLDELDNYIKELCQTNKKVKRK